MKRIGFRDKTGILFFCLRFRLIGRPCCNVDGLFVHLFPGQDKVLPIDFQKKYDFDVKIGLTYPIFIVHNDKSQIEE